MFLHTVLVCLPGPGVQSAIAARRQSAAAARLQRRELQGAAHLQHVQDAAQIQSAQQLCVGRAEQVSTFCLRFFFSIQCD